MKAQVLYVKKEDGSFVDTQVFFCGQCRVVYRSKEEADVCCAPKVYKTVNCEYCGKEVPNPGFTYPPTWHTECRTDGRLANAEVVDEIDCCDMFFDPHRDIIDTLEMLQDYYYCEPDGERPEFFFCCEEIPWRGIDVEGAIECALDDIEDEDGSMIDRIEDLEKLQAFVDKWNAKQTLKTYEVDYTKKIKLNWEEES